tara:strand:+ start:311 stop:853 length:543 start_codon:yes stop_codon:yes gene_type:complete
MISLDIYKNGNHIEIEFDDSKYDLEQMREDWKEFVQHNDRDSFRDYCEWEQENNFDEDDDDFDEDEHEAMGYYSDGGIDYMERFPDKDMVENVYEYHLKNLMDLDKYLLEKKREVMSKYEVVYKLTERHTFVVEANSEQEANLKAQEEIDGGGLAEHDPNQDDWYYSDTLEIPEQEGSDD